MALGRRFLASGLLLLAAEVDALAADAGGACPSTDPIDPASLAYVSPEAPMPGACSAADLAAIKATLPTSGSDDEVKKKISAACAACVFTDANATKWGPVPETNQGGMNVPVTIDVGGCYEEQTGDMACGKAYQNLIDCGLVACSGCPDGDMTAYDNCLKASNTGACAVEVTNYQTACNAIMDKYTAARDVCEPTDQMYLFEGTIAVFCGGAGDGGASSGSSGTSGGPVGNVPSGIPTKDAGSDGANGASSSSSSGCSSAGGADASPIAILLGAGAGVVVFSRRRSAGSRSSRSVSRTSRSPTRRT